MGDTCSHPLSRGRSFNTGCGLWSFESTLVPSGLWQWLGKEHSEGNPEPRKARMRACSQVHREHQGSRGPLAGAVELAFRAQRLNKQLQWTQCTQMTDRQRRLVTQSPFDIKEWFSLVGWHGCHNHWGCPRCSWVGSRSRVPPASSTFWLRMVAPCAVCKPLLQLYRWVTYSVWASNLFYMHSCNICPGF